MEYLNLLVVTIVSLSYFATATPADGDPLLVTSILTEDVGYLRYRRSVDEEPLVGNDRFEGFIAELIALLARRLGQEYDIRLVKDGKYGSIQQDGTWNGMIGELIRGEVDMAVAPLRITAARERVVDFSKPFFADGYKMLMNNHTSLYVKSWEDLVTNDEVTVLLVQDSDEENELKMRVEQVYQQIYDKYVSNPESKVTSYRNGITMIRTADESHPKVLVMPGTFADFYASQAPCDLAVEGLPWQLFGYGIATPEGSPLTSSITLAILELREDGSLQKLETKWWYDRATCEM